MDPKDVPGKATGKKGSVYAATVGEFMRSGAAAIKVDCGLKHPHSISGQLAKHVRMAGLSGSVSVQCRQGRVFMVRVKR